MTPNDRCGTLEEAIARALAALDDWPDNAVVDDEYGVTFGEFAEGSGRDGFYWRVTAHVSYTAGNTVGGRIESPKQLADQNRRSILKAGLRAQARADRKRRWAQLDPETRAELEERAAELAEARDAEVDPLDLLE